MPKFANQKALKINKSKYSKNFLQIGIEEWQQAYKNLKPSAFAVYLYLSGNKDGYAFELSPAAIENAIGIKRSAYYAAIEQLEQKGYIVGGNFYTTPNSTNVEKAEIPQSTIAENKSTIADENSINVENKSTIADKTVHDCDIVIDNIYNIDNTDNNICGDSSPKENSTNVEKSEVEITKVEFVEKFRENLKYEDTYELDFNQGKITKDGIKYKVIDWCGKKG